MHVRVSRALDRAPMDLPLAGAPTRTQQKKIARVGCDRVALLIRRRGVLYCGSELRPVGWDF
jgi:hypothetical protein